MRPDRKSHVLDMKKRVQFYLLVPLVVSNFKNEDVRKLYVKIPNKRKCKEMPGDTGQFSGENQSYIFSLERG